MLLYIILVLPILFQFASPLPFISLGELLLIVPMISCGYSILRTHKITIKKDLVIFYFVPIFCCFFSLFSIEYFKLINSATVVLRIIFYFILITIFTSQRVETKHLKFYLNICIICAVYLLAQVVSHYFGGKDLPILLEYSDILLGSKDNFGAEQYYMDFGFRPASLFVEPSWFVDYIIPSVIIVLFEWELLKKDPKGLLVKNRIILITLFIFSIIFSTSNLGIAYMIVSIIYYVYKSRNLLYRMILLLILACCTVTFFQSDLFSFSAGRLLSGGSIGPRVIRGLLIYDHFSFWEMIFGIGLNNIGNYVIHYSIYTIYDENNLNYTVTSTNRLLTCGMIGVLSLCYFVYNRYVTYPASGLRCLTFVLAISFLFTNGEYTATFAFFYCLYEIICSLKQ